MHNTIKLIAAQAHVTGDTARNAIKLANDADPRTLVIDGVERIDLNFPRFTDGRAYSQAFLLRRRLGFKGELRATGDVLIDQLLQMQRSGFNAAVLRADQDGTLALRELQRYTAFYQGDAVTPRPQFGGLPNLPRSQSAA
jgi:uncharacterized protein (DUF934 family)